MALTWLKVKTTSKEIEQWGNSLRTYVYLMSWLQSIAKISAIATAAAAVLGIFLVSWIPVIITGSIFVVSFLLSFIAAGMVQLIRMKIEREAPTPTDTSPQ